MKVLTFFFAFLIANSIYGGACGGAYTFNYGTYNNCIYWFVPSVPGSPAIDSFAWRIGSTGAYQKQCDIVFSHLSTDTMFYYFCYSGNHSVTMSVIFSSGATCFVNQTVNVTCSGADVCDPDPSRTDPITDPTVEITYISPDTCDFNRVTPVNGCMYSAIGGGSNNYYIACGWIWAIRIPPSSYRCHKFSYYVQYDSITSCGNYTCVQTALDTQILCIKAYINRTIYIVATSSSCCLPNGYQRGYYWTPGPSSGNLSPISDPSPSVSTLCTAYRNCNNYIYCVTNPITMNQTYGWPGSCFTGGKKTEKRDYIKLDDDLIKEQDVVIYNIQGIEVFKGKWKFGDPNILYLNWPSGIGSGMYFVKFQNSTGKALTKLYKF